MVSCFGARMTQENTANYRTVENAMLWIEDIKNWMIENRSWFPIWWLKRFTDVKDPINVVQVNGDSESIDEKGRDFRGV